MYSPEEQGFVSVMLKEVETLQIKAKELEQPTKLTVLQLAVQMNIDPSAFYVADNGEVAAIPFDDLVALYRLRQGKEEEVVVCCSQCLQPLSDEEQKYYGHHCEECESQWSAKVTAWRKGADNPELDEMFSAPEPTKH